MKKIGLIFLVIFVCLQTYAQKTVYGKYKGKSVKLVYFEGDPDIIKSIEYERVGDLEKENSNLQSQIALKNKKIAELQSTVGGPNVNKTQTDSLNNVIKKLQMDKDKLSSDVKNNNLEITKLKGSLQPVKDSLNLVKLEKATISLKLSDLDTKNKNLTSQIAEKDKKIKELQETALKTGGNKEQIAALNKDIEKLQTEKTKLSADINNNNTEILKLKGSIQPLKDSLNLAKSEKSSMSLKVSDLETKNKNLTSQIAEKDEKIKDLQETALKTGGNNTQIAALNKDIEKLKTEKNKLSADLNNNNTEILKLRGSLQPLKDSLNFVKSEKSSMSIIVSDLETKNKNLTSQIAEKDKKIKALQESAIKTGGTNEQIAALNADIEKLQTEKNKLSADINNNNIEIIKLKGSIQPIKDSLNLLKTEKTSMYIKVSDLETKNKNLTNQIAEKDKKIKELQKGKSNINGSEKQKEQVDSLNNEIKKLQTEKDNLSDDIKNNYLEITKLKAVQQPIKDSLNRANNEIKLLEDKLNRKAKDNYKSAPSIAVSYASGLPFLFTNIMKSGIWDKTNTMSNQLSIIYEQPLGLVSLGLGLGITNLKLKAGFSNYEEIINGLTDADNDTYNAICSYKDVKEDVSLLYMDIPIVLSFGQPRVHRVGAYCKIGITASINLQNKFKGEGKYNISGYYPQWDVQIHDVDELNFKSDAPCYENADYKVNRFVLWGNLSGGVYLPISNIKEGKDARFILKLGARCDYSLMPISKQLEELYKGSNYRIKQSNILSGKGTRILSPGLEISFIFMLAKPQ